MLGIYKNIDAYIIIDVVNTNERKRFYTHKCLGKGVMVYAKKDKRQ